MACSLVGHVRYLLHFVLGCWTTRNERWLSLFRDCSCRNDGLVGDLLHTIVLAVACLVAVAPLLELVHSHPQNRSLRVNLVTLTMPAPRPLLPQQQTFKRTALSDEKCQLQT